MMQLRRRVLPMLIMLLGVVPMLACSDLAQSFAGSATPAPQQAANGLQLGLEPVVRGLDRPVFVTHAGDGSGRIFVVEQRGVIRVVQDGQLLATPLLDIADARVSCCGERGLLSVAFPPDFANKRHFYLNFTDKQGATVVARYRLLPDDDNAADPASEQVILRIEQPFPNHNGGQLQFGRDGYLYIGTGDGGSAGDPQNIAQNTNDLLGKLLRIDVEGASGDQPYLIPPTNPYTTTAGYRPEIWALGLRNPWRFSFDRATGDLYIGDVGQGNIEEISYQPASSGGGENYGWRCKEGTRDFNMGDNCAEVQLVPPIHEYDHSAGNCSVTGGYVYRGSEFARMQGIYFYGDYCSGLLWGLHQAGGEWVNELLLETQYFGSLSSFGEDEAGNLYVTNLSDGTVAKLVDQATATSRSRIWLPLIRAQTSLAMTAQ